MCEGTNVNTLTRSHINTLKLLFSQPKFKVKMLKQCKLIFVLCGVLLISLAGCQDKADVLTRTWKLQDLRYTKKIPDLMKPTIQQSIDALKKSYVISYSPDGTFAAQMNDKSIHGTWKLNYNSSKISVETDNGQKKDFKILELTASSYSFVANENGQEVIFVMIPAN